MARVIGLDGKPLDDLPPDVDDPFAEYTEPDDSSTYVKHAEFRASVKGSRVLANGHMLVTLQVPMEDKYLALPLTDILGILLVFSAYRPVRDSTYITDETSAEN